MAVISDYEEEEPMQQFPTSTQLQPHPSEPVKPAQELRPEPPTAEELHTPSPAVPAPHSDTKVYHHDAVLTALLEEHKRQPLEVLTTIIDFLFRETELSRESRVEDLVTGIVAAVKRRRKTYDGEDVAPEKIAKVEETTSSKKELPPSKITQPSTPIPNTRKPKHGTVQSSDDTPSPFPSEETDIDSEGTGLTPTIGNGFDHDTYSWTQTLSEVTVHVKLPDGTKAKGVACEIKRMTLTAGLKGQQPVLQGEFYTPVKSDDCFWSLEDDRTLSIYLTKCNSMGWWRSVLKGEPEINTRKVMPENSRLDELDSETRSTAEKLMYDQRQKAMGLPTSDDTTKSEAIKKFMAQHPEMDFSKATIG